MSPSIKRILLFCVSIFSFICPNGHAQNPKGWGSPERPTIEQARAFVERSQQSQSVAPQGLGSRFNAGLENELMASASLGESEASGASAPQGATFFKWSSLADYARGKGPDWLATDRLLNAFELAKDGRGRRAYVAWLEARAANDGGKVDEAAMKALKRGWYLGEPTFADKLLALVSPQEKGQASRDPVSKSHDEAESENSAKRALKILGLPLDQAALSKLGKGDWRKVLVAVLLRERTAVGNRWVTERLAMGHTGGVSRLIGGFRRDKKMMKHLKEVDEMLQ